MARLFVALAALLACPALALFAQTVSPQPWPNGSAALNSGWRVHGGDDPAWAQPNFDDSDWPVIALTPANNGAGWRWYRLRTQMPPGSARLALLITGGNGTFEVYCNGQRLPGPELRSALYVTYPRSRTVPLPAAAGDAVIALRTFVPPTSMFLADRGSLRVSLGTFPDIENAHRAELSGQFDSVVLGLAVDLLLLFGGIPFLILFWYQSEHREYLWLGCYLILCAIGNGTYATSSATGLIPFSTNWFLSTPANYLETLCQIELTFCFVGRKVTRGWRIYEALLVAWPVFFLFPAWFGFLSRAVFDVVEIFLLVPASLILPVLLLVWYRRGNREAGWLILPSIFPLLTTSVADVGIIGDYLGIHRLAVLDKTVPLGHFSIEPFDIAALLFLLAIGVVMFIRFTRVSREQARTAAELQAGREIQQRLVPASLPPVAGYRLEAVYLPAEEVGGDFYQVLEQGDGATLIVVGDVSGKGLKAAMTGTLAIGALRTMPALSPARILAALNRGLAGQMQAGFVTCCAARIDPSGAVTLANAGHLAPYRNGVEVELPPGLPLGLTSEADYEETTLQLAPDETLTFLSDGVVEARDAAGDLFGFERTRAISGQSAEAIAAAAQRFGQEDDITVLTLAFAPAAVAVSSPVHRPSQRMGV
jgi:hypothetical protein